MVQWVKDLEVTTVAQVQFLVQEFQHAAGTSGKKKIVAQTELQLLSFRINSLRAIQLEP